MSKSLVISSKQFNSAFPIEHVAVLVKDTKRGEQWKGVVDKVEIFDMDGEAVSAFRVNHVWYKHSDRKPLYGSKWLEGLEVHLLQTYHTKF